MHLVDASHQQPSNVAVFFTVDTGKGEPVPGLSAESFKIYEDGQLVSLDESLQTIVNPEVAAAHYTLLLVDMSGSVTQSDQVPLIGEASQSFMQALDGTHQVGVFAFDGSEDIYQVSPFAGSARAGRGVKRLMNFKGKDPSTNLHGALKQAASELTDALEKDESPLKFGTLVVFTDGTDRAARVSLTEAVEALDEAMIDVFAIGVGNDLDEDMLSAVGRSGYVLVDNAGALRQAFEVISGRILAFTQSYYLLSYCSPARAGQHEVTIVANATAEDETSSKGELNYQFDATGFGPKCDPRKPPPFELGHERPLPRQRAKPERLRLDVDVQVAAQPVQSAEGSAAGSSEGRDGKPDAPPIDESLENEVPPMLDPEAGVE